MSASEVLISKTKIIVPKRRVELLVDKIKENSAKRAGLVGMPRKAG